MHPARNSFAIMIASQNNHTSILHTRQTVQKRNICTKHYDNVTVPKQNTIQKRRHHTNYYSQLENPHPCVKYLSNVIMYSTFCHHPQGMQTHVQSCLSFLCCPFHAVQPKQGIEIHWNRENKLHLTMGVLSHQYLTDCCKAHLFQAFFHSRFRKESTLKNIKKYHSLDFSCAKDMLEKNINKNEIQKFNF